MCVAHANEGFGGRAEVLARLDHTLQRMRRAVVRPPGMGVPLPDLGRPIDVAKVLACEAVADLAREGDPVTVGDVAAVLQLERSTTSRLLGECEAEGLLVRGSMPGDGRKVTLTLTECGQVAVAGSQVLRTDFLTHVAEDFTDDDLATMTDLLDRFADNLAGRIQPWLAAQAQLASANASRATSSESPGA